MWKSKIINGYRCEVKVYGEPSEIYGINGGRISKLWIGRDRKTYANYDRGWDIVPETDEIREIYEALLREFN